MLGWLLAAFFFLQAIFALLSLFALPQGGGSSDPTQVQLNVDLYNGLYRMFNFFTLGCIIALYFEGIRKMVAKQDVSRVSALDRSDRSASEKQSVPSSSFGSGNSGYGSGAPSSTESTYGQASRSSPPPPPSRASPPPSRSERTDPPPSRGASPPPPPSRAGTSRGPPPPSRASYRS